MNNGINHDEDWKVPERVFLLLGLLISRYEHTVDEFDYMSNAEILSTLKEIENLLDRLEFLEFNYGNQ